MSLASDSLLLRNYDKCFISLDEHAERCDYKMAPMQGFLRRRGANSSEVDIRRQSTLLPNAAQPGGEIESRTSEQLPRRPSPAEFLQRQPSSHSKTMPAVNEPSIDPIQEESNKHRRFSMLKFRNASDSQLSTRARLQAEAAAPPPMPKRKFLDRSCCPGLDT